MLLLNKQRLEPGAANDEKDPQYQAAKFYLEGTKRLRETYGRFIRFIDPKQPRHTRGANARGEDIPKMKEPDTITRIPLSATYVDENRGSERWSCCLGEPVIHPNGQYDIGTIRAITVTSDKVVDMNRDMDLAFFLAYISPFTRSKVLKIDNPKEDAKRLGDKKRAQVQREMAIWSMLTDEDKLRTMASAYGVPRVHEKEPDVIRMELEKILSSNDERRKSDLTVRGTTEFLEEMKVEDSVLLRAFIQDAIDQKSLVYKINGNWQVGERVIYKVPDSAVDKKFDYLCNYLASNKDKLKDLLSDLITQEYLDNIKDQRVYTWLAKVNDIGTVGKPKNKLKQEIEKIYYGGSSASE